MMVFIFLRIALSLLSTFSKYFHSRRLCSTRKYNSLTRKEKFFTQRKVWHIASHHHLQIFSSYLSTLFNAIDVTLKRKETSIFVCKFPHFKFFFFENHLIHDSVMKLKVPLTNRIDKSIICRRYIRLASK